MPTPTETTNLRLAVPLAQASARRWGVPASVTLAQWIIESSWGTSGLAVKACNCFGVKSYHVASPDSYVEMPTAEIEHGQRVVEMARFERYANRGASFDAHANLLATAARYKPAMLVADHPAAFAAQLQLCGYSTNPDYTAQLLHLMQLYNLTQYDITPPADAAAQKAA